MSRSQSPPNVLTDSNEDGRPCSPISSRGSLAASSGVWATAGEFAAPPAGEGPLTSGALAEVTAGTGLDGTAGFDAPAQLEAASGTNKLNCHSAHVGRARFCASITIRAHSSAEPALQQVSSTEPDFALEVLPEPDFLRIAHFAEQADQHAASRAFRDELRGAP